MERATGHAAVVTAQLIGCGPELLLEARLTAVGVGVDRGRLRALSLQLNSFVGRDPLYRGLP
jgi:hypothetical protein